MTTLYLMFARGELAGLERGRPGDETAAQREAAQLLARNQDVSAVEIWSGGRLLATGRRLDPAAG